MEDVRLDVEKLTPEQKVALARAGVLEQEEDDTDNFYHVVFRSLVTTPGGGYAMGYDERDVDYLGMGPFGYILKNAKNCTDESGKALILPPDSVLWIGVEWKKKDTPKEIDGKKVSDTGVGPYL